jgi:hypothetical protein
MSEVAPTQTSAPAPEPAAAPAAAAPAGTTTAAAPAADNRDYLDKGTYLSVYLSVHARMHPTLDLSTYIQKKKKKIRD